MTTCAQALQGDLWETGGYIDWLAVEQFLWESYVALAPQVTGQPTFEQAQSLLLLVNTLEMMYGEDILSSYVGGFFSTTDFEKIFNNLVSAQTPISARNGPNSVPSGDAGWWGPGDHHIVNSADFYLCLRRNPTAVDILINSHGLPPCGLEHVLLPTTDLADLTSQLPGGGLVGLDPWLQETAWSCAIPGGPCPPDVTANPPRPTNFWGELIGTVALYEAMRDQVPLIQSSGWVCDPLRLTPMGDRIVEAWQLWRERFDSVNNGLPFLSTYSQRFPPQPSFAEWAGPPTYLSVLDASGNVDPAVGQDWDVSLHQLARAVQAMHHLGYAFTTADQELVVERLGQWATATCEAYDPSISCSPDALSRTDPTYAVPSERYGWTEFEGGASCSLTQPNIPSPAVSAMVAAANALAWVGALNQPANASIATSAFSMARSIVIALGTLYRTTSTGSAGWANVSSNDPTRPYAAGTAPDLRGTATAIAALFVLARTPELSGILGSSPTASLAKQAGLDNFLHFFGGSISQTAGSHPWVASYVPG